MATNDMLQLGMSLNFDSEKEAKKLDGLLKKVQEIANSLNKATESVKQFNSGTSSAKATVAKFSQEYGVLQERVAKFANGQRIVTDTYRDQLGYLTKIKTVTNENGELLKQECTTIGKIAKLDREREKNNNALVAVEKQKAAIMEKEKALAEAQRRIQNDIVSKGTLLNSRRSYGVNGDSVTSKYKDNETNVVRRVTEQYDKYNKLVNISAREVGLLEQKVITLSQTMKHNITKMGEWMVAGTLLMGTIRLLGDAFKTMTEAQSEMVNIKKVMPNGADTRSLQEFAKTVSKTYGVDVVDSMKAMQSWARKTKDVNDIMVLTEASMRGAAVTDLTLENSFKALSAVMAQFKLQAADSLHVIDSFNELSNNMRVSANDLAEGLAKIGSAAKIMNIDLDKSMALVGTMVETTGVSGRQAGTVLSRMLARINTKDAQAQFRSLGISTKDAGQAIEELGLKWDSLTAAQKENVAKALGGTHHYQRLMTLFGSYNRVIEATIMSYGSLGSAQKEAELALSTYNKKVEQLKAVWQSFAISVGNVLLPFITNLVSGFKAVLEFGNGIIPMLALVAAGIWAASAAWAAYAINQARATWGLSALVATIVMAGIGWASQANGINNITAEISKMEQASSEATQSAKEVDYLASMYDKLSKKIGNLSKTSKDYQETNKLRQTTEDRLNKLMAENGIAIDKVAGKTENYKKKIAELVAKMKEKAEKERESLRDSLTTKISELENEIKATQAMIDLSENRIQQYKKEGIIKSLLYKDNFKEFFKNWWGLIKQGRFWDAFDYDLFPDRLKKKSQNKLLEQQQELSLLRQKLSGTFITDDDGDGGDGGDDGKADNMSVINSLIDDRVALVNSLAEAYKRLQDAVHEVNASIIDSLRDMSNQFNKFWPNQKLNLPIFNDMDKMFKTAMDKFEKNDDNLRKQQGDIDEKQKKYTEEYQKQKKILANPKASDEAKATAFTNMNEINEIQKKLAESLEDVTQLFNKARNDWQQNIDLQSYYDGLRRSIQSKTFKPYNEMNSATKALEDAGLGYDAGFAGSMNELNLKKAVRASQEKMLSAQQEILDMLNKEAESLKQMSSAGGSAGAAAANKLTLVDGLQGATKEYIENLKKGMQKTDGSAIANSLKALFNGEKGLFETIAEYGSKNMKNSIDNFVERFVQVFDFGGNKIDKSVGGLMGGITGAKLGSSDNGFFASVKTAWGKMKPQDKANLFAGGLSLVASKNGAGQKTMQGIQMGAQLGSAFGPWGTVIGAALGSLISNKKPSSQYKSQISGVTDLFSEYAAGGEKWKKHWWNSSTRDLEATMLKLAAALKVSVDDIASSLNNAFQATNYADFLSSWSQNLESMTRNALIQAFLSSSAYQGLYKNLSDVLMKATMDGFLTNSEKADINAASDAIKAQMRQLYDALNAAGLADISGSSGSSGGGGNYTAGSSSTIVYNNYVSLNTQAFMGDEDDAMAFANKISKYITVQQGRA